MSRLSHFQTLPEHIVEKIVDYYLNKRENGLNDSSAAGLSVLHSCSAWRAMFVKRTLSLLDINLCFTSQDIASFPKWPAKIKKPTFSTDCFVKKISFSYNAWPPAADGDALETFSMTFPSGTSFALVRSIDMSINLSNRFDTFETRDQLGKVLLYFKGLVPNTQNIAFSNYDTDAFGPSEGFNEELRNTVFGFIKGIREVSVWGLRTAEFLDHINPADFVNLVRFDFICHGESTAFNTIVRNNAKTLRSLHADYEFDTRISSILYDEDGNTMVYPCLESLNIWGDRQDDRTPIEDQQLHFPAIKDFCVWVCDSLCYDVFFNNQNSNFRSLRSLEMVNVPEFIDNAHESYAISTKQLVNLWKLSFEIKLFLDDSHYSNPGEADQANIRFIRMLSRIPNALGYLRISGVIAEGPFMDLMTSGCGFESLQDIVLPNISLGLGNIFELMKTAPLLCSISAHTKEEYPSIQNVASEDLAQNVKTNFRSLGRHITHISLHTRNGSDNLSNYCMTVALLVIACPRLASIVNYGLGKQELKTSLLELRNNEDFVEYGDRFKLLAGNIDN